MRHRTIVSLALLPLLVTTLGACGDDNVVAPAADATTEPSAGDGPTGTASDVPDTETSADGYGHATGADDVVIEVGVEGGFMMAEAAFAQSPNLLVTGDGRSITTGPVTAIFPGPLLANLQQRTITEAATQDLLALADELGLLADVEYERNDMLADAPDTVVTITVDDTIYEHRAYALGIDEETDPARRQLAEYVAATADLPAVVGEAEMGPEAAYGSDQYLVRATPTDPATLDTDVPATIVEWPADAPVRLAAAAECAAVPAAAVEALFAEANQLTLFSEGGVTYGVAATAQLPGRDC